MYLQSLQLKTHKTGQFHKARGADEKERKPPQQGGPVTWLWPPDWRSAAVGLW